MTDGRRGRRCALGQRLRARVLQGLTQLLGSHTGGGRVRGPGWQLCAKQSRALARTGQARAQRLNSLLQRRCGALVA